LPFLRIAIRQIGRLEKRSIGLDGVQVAANVEFAKVNTDDVIRGNLILPILG
jgi:hypothetical protein